MKNKMVYIASPYAGEVEENIRFAKAACLYAIQQGCTPLAVHLLYPQLLDDSDPAQREAGVCMGLRVLEACDELWLCGDRVSPGMTTEQAAAERLDKPIRTIPRSKILGAAKKKFGIWAVRSAASVYGAAEAWLKDGGRPLLFDTLEEADGHAQYLNAGRASTNIRYYAKEAEPELAPHTGMKLI